MIQPQPATRRQTRFMLRKRWIALILVGLILTSTMIVHTQKEVPDGLSYESPVYRTDDVKFLYNLSYQQGDKRAFEDGIYKAWYGMIQGAEEYIVFDMFLLNSYYDKGQEYPELAGKLTDLITEQKKKHPELKVYFITDEVNTSYGSHKVPYLERLKESGAEVVITDMKPMRDSNPLYSGVWRAFFQWFGQSGDGWMKNPQGSNAPDVTLRSNLKLLNIKANHRKVLMTENGAMVMSANAHDASYYNGNIAFQFEGPIMKEVWSSEQAVVRMSGRKDALPAYPGEASAGRGEGNIALQWLTESKIQKHVVQAIKEAGEGDRVRIGMFFIEDRSIVEPLLAASKRGADIQIVLDVNENSFGHKKSGMPNRPIAAELLQRSDERIQIKWYETEQEQYHTKLLLVEHPDRSVIIGGSANYTRRTLDDLNLEANLKMEAPSESELVKSVGAYFERIWNNKDGVYTVPYEKHNDELPFFKQALYVVQKVFNFTTY
ncbi:phospholipase D family protein [Paenibacillus sp. GCM10023252]|uniref:phospholipase D family protein n=1 Tax=Paenibacillus sp. GCM10023252 TaxID=3252649 RepID=UPI003620FD9D